MNVLILFLLMCHLTSVTAGGFSWGSLFFAADDDTTQDESKQEIEPKSQFELSADQDRFIQAYNEYLDLPELDRCLNEAVERLAYSCRDMPEEQLGKLTVWLYNCHAQAEGRTTFRCSQDMDLAECTSPMSESAWGTYQVISNRARAFCYRTSQDQFARKVELSVNQLTMSATNQMKSMDELQGKTESIIKDASARNEEFKLQQEENLHNYKHLRDVHGEALFRMRERASLDNDLYQQTFDRILGFSKLIGNMTHSFRISTLNQTIDMMLLSKNITQSHKQLLTFNSTLTRWFYQVANRISVHLSDIDLEAQKIMGVMDSLATALVENINQMTLVAKALNRTLHEANQESVKKGFHLSALPDHLTLLFLTLTLSLLFEPSQLMKLVSLSIVSTASALYIHTPNPVYLSFAILFVPLIIIVEQVFVWLSHKRKNVVVDPQSLNTSSPYSFPPINPTPIVHPPEDYPPLFTTNFRENPFSQMNGETPSRESSPGAASVTSNISTVGIRCAAMTKVGLHCKKRPTKGGMCSYHGRMSTLDLS